MADGRWITTKKGRYVFIPEDKDVNEVLKEKFSDDDDSEDTEFDYSKYDTDQEEEFDDKPNFLKDANKQEDHDYEHNEEGLNNDFDDYKEEVNWNEEGFMLGKKKGLSDEDADKLAELIYNFMKERKK